MATANKISKTIIVPAAKIHTATVILFHGSGDSGAGIKEWVDILNRQELRFPHIKILYPTAPLQPYSLNGGVPSNVWFDRKRLWNEAEEDVESTNSICEEAVKLIDRETENGITHSRIVIGGFSMGGALSFHLAYRYKRSLAGCFAMSSFLDNKSLVYEVLKNGGREGVPPLLQFHGTADELVPFEWGERTNRILSDLGVKTEFVKLPEMNHELNRIEIHKLKDWILKVLPEHA